MTKMRERRPICTVALATCLAFLWSVPCGAEEGAAKSSTQGKADSPPLTGKADPRMAPFDDLLTAFVRDHKIPGAALAVTKNGRLVYTRGCGHADVHTK